jgi:histidinol phosphatase-like enzyme
MHAQLFHQFALARDAVQIPEQGCAYRKPLPGMVERAASDLGFEPRDSFVVRDKACDMELGRCVGATTLLVRTGYGQETSSAGVKTDYTVQDLSEAAAVIARHVNLDAQATVRYPIVAPAQRDNRSGD